MRGAVLVPRLVLGELAAGDAAPCCVVKSVWQALLQRDTKGKYDLSPLLYYMTLSTDGKSLNKRSFWRDFDHSRGIGP